MTFYLIRTRYEGPNQTAENFRDCEGYMTIETKPGGTNMSGEERTSGWLGTTNDWNKTACGEYDTTDEARTAATKCGYTEPVEAELVDVENLDFVKIDMETFELIALEIYTTKDGAKAVWMVEDYMYQWARDNITAETTDEEIVRFAEESETEAEQENVYIYGGVEDYLMNVRDELCENLKYETKIGICH